MLRARGLKKSFRGGVHAVRGVSFDIGRSEAVGLVGESGSGKSTLAKLAACLLRPDAGEIYFEEKKVSGEREKNLSGFRQNVQSIFQDPLSSFDPRMTMGASLEEALHLSGRKNNGELRENVRSLLASVGLPEGLAGRLPHQISGGECQRVSIARALSRGPQLLICDEPVSSLDLLAQARTLNLLLRLQNERRIALLLISHDIRVIRHLCDRILVMKDGQLCETGNVTEVFARPRHPYTQELLISSGLASRP